MDIWTIWDGPDVVVTLRSGKYFKVKVTFKYVSSVRNEESEGELFVPLQELLSFNRRGA